MDASAPSSDARPPGAANGNDSDEPVDDDETSSEASNRNSSAVESDNPAALRAEIDSLKQEVQSLREAAKRYRSLVDLTTDAAYDLELTHGDSDSPTFKLTWASSSFSRMIGISQGRLLADGDWLDHVHPADRMLVRRHREHLASGSRMVTEYRIQSRSDHVRWVCDYGQPIHGPGGVRRVHGALREITFERRYDQAMRANRMKYKHIFNQSPLGILHFDANGCITQCNNNFVRIIGSSREQLIGLNMLEDLHDSKMIRAVKDALEHGSGAYEGDYESVTADKVTPVRCLFNSIRSEAGEVMGGVGIVEDITERRRYEQQLIEARDEAETMNQLKSAFLANMSHEIRTPLTAIIGFADILTDELPSTQRRIPQLIEQSGKRLLDTLNSVLDLSMLESGEMELNLQMIDVPQHVEDHVDLMQPLADNKNLTLRIERLPESRYAMLDEGALDRILSNLIGNAIKFTDSGEITVVVRDAPFPNPTPFSDDEDEQEVQPSPNGGIEIRVKDTGVGISEEFLPQLFDVFKQESAGMKRTHEGSGLGLAITKHLVDHLSGQISVRSSKNKGSTFVVTFPTVRGANGAEPSPHSRLARHQQGHRILVAEDNPETQALIDRILSTYHDVTIVNAADDALQAAQENRSFGKAAYDVIILDINLEGGGSGLDLLPQLRALPNYAQTPIIALTAFALSGDRERFIEAGFDAYLGKPFTSDQLLDMVDQVLASDR
ncbi:hypothetical protein CRI94_06885 [Longibacter salinarum]|uniref:histidine kinase n=1 Tax=Longibacter salinarum TaxID=1850348 RepID=A0A2A8CZG1_9BACT|nr:PAS domain-containing hybrid sensor histidine kinase/response regulator [Longibacter salinarum]PEN13788.1 hypothetical protein CRI94_06885 [Longibacter salinarum]